MNRLLAKTRVAATLTTLLLCQTLPYVSAAADEPGAAQKLAGPADYGLSNSVSIALGGNEQGYGLKHISNLKDGLTTVETIDGVAARSLRLDGTRTTLNFYFQIEPGFKEKDLGNVRFEIEYLAPQLGTLGIHYDAMDSDTVKNARYREASVQITLQGSRDWKKATFHTRGDAIFSNRQNGRADFRIWAKTPVLHIRQVTVTREASLDEKWNNQFSGTNQVTVLLGQEKPDEEGLRYVTQGGHATPELLGGVPCRHLDRTREGRMFASIYFAISPGFKRQGLKNARVDIEYLAKPETAFRLQYDAMEGDTRRLYKPLLPAGAKVMRFGTGADYATIPNPGVWSTATFHLTNGVFANSQRDGADFRLEVLPPEIYLRRVTVTREDAAPAIRPTSP
ncbi:MAG: hypothetical protein JWM16_1828 [Verrucomicrobiales bacterium]|nr:hypothetical protein [Verrucomicrobiales bacterium]